MHKVLTERPRRGHQNPSRKWGGRVGEDYDGAAFVSSARRRQYGWESKEFSDFLAPLQRFLRGQTGRPWDKVYSEIRKAVPGGLHGDHMWQHVRWAVETNCFERDGRVFARPRYYSGEVEVSGLYVHPRTRLLCYKDRNSKATSRKPARPLEVIRFGAHEEYRKIEGVWYYRKFVRLEAPGQAQFQLIAKKQLSRRELRELEAAHPEILDRTAMKPQRV